MIVYVAYYLRTTRYGDLLTFLSVHKTLDGAKAAIYPNSKLQEDFRKRWELGKIWYGPGAVEVREMEVLP